MQGMRTPWLLLMRTTQLPEASASSRNVLFPPQLLSEKHAHCSLPSGNEPQIAPSGGSRRGEKTSVSTHSLPSKGQTWGHKVLSTGSRGPNFSQKSDSTLFDNSTCDSN